MKKYCYYYIDLDESIYADSGSEAERIYNETHYEEYKGNILLTNTQTGQSNMMYHIEIPSKF